MIDRALLEENLALQYQVRMGNDWFDLYLTEVLPRAFRELDDLRTVQTKVEVFLAAAEDVPHAGRRDFMMKYRFAEEPERESTVPPHLLRRKGASHKQTDGYVAVMNWLDGI